MSDYILTGIGRRIKELRKDKGRKLTEVAQTAGISKGLLSKIENGRTVPSLPVLLSIIKALNMRPDAFFEKLNYEAPQRYIHKSAEHLVPIKKEEEATGFNYNFILDKAFENFAIESVVLEIEPGAKRKKVRTDAYEFKYILEGEINYQIDDEFVLLKKGDTLLYNGNIPHVPHNETDQKARMLVIYFYYNSSK